MSRRILDALRDEERSLRRQFVAIQRAVDAIEGNTLPETGPRTKKVAKAVSRRKRTMSEERRRRPRADAQVLGISRGGQDAGARGPSERRPGLPWRLGAAWPSSSRVRPARRARPC